MSSIALHYCTFAVVQSNVCLPFISATNNDDTDTASWHRTSTPIPGGKATTFIHFLAIDSMIRSAMQLRYFTAIALLLSIPPCHFLLPLVSSRCVYLRSIQLVERSIVMTIVVALDLAVVIAASKVSVAHLLRAFRG
ncbi:hypothetical protein EGR_07669 [Echinococcus granulosus]|uniref:Uncharacterized protein n=1 Tax=Echinococcus granulosus TaxID=6210 RepID=W6UH28_ECHGR|nr:hypothetical protein EGR_07669 [Echinococcus granulosus]EUB57427.1 hypothetical protein EGR_07669 [Echinococcus granulosus]